MAANLYAKGATAFAAMMASTLMMGVATAQDEEGDTAESIETEDVIVVRSARTVDYAMDAFNRGDFQTAEIEFTANARCAQRRERNLTASVESSQRNAARAETFQSAQPSDSGASSRGGGASSTPPPTVAGPGATDSITSDREAPLGRTCDDRGFQHYMTGLSQLQLGKIDDALKNFNRAVVLNKVLYDAHYRIALIALLRDDRKTAERQLRSIEAILRRCRKCEAKDEIQQRVDHIKKALSGEVPTN